MIRKVLAGGFAALSLAVLLAGLVSFWHPLWLGVFRPPGGAFFYAASSFDHGVAYLRWAACVRAPPPARVDRSITWFGFKWSWQQDVDAATYRVSDGTLYTVGYNRNTCVMAPFWLLGVLLAAYPLTWLARAPFRRTRRRRAGLCIKCGYNLTGNVSGRCPECGAMVVPSSKIAR